MIDVTPSRAEKTMKEKLNWQTSKWRKTFHIGLWVIFIVAIATYYYIVLPPIHYASTGFWFFLFLICAGLFGMKLLSDGATYIQFKELPKFSFYKLMIYPWIIVLVVGFVSQLIMSPFFMAKQYANLIQVEQADFQADFVQTDTNNIPLVDRDTATRLGNRKIGALSHLVSQFEASEDYTQINVKNHPYRVTPLEYAGFFKWLNNFQAGIPNYLKVDMVTGDVSVEKPAQPIKYSYADKFNRNIMRHLRFNYPFTIFGAPDFEIDDEGNPYYIATTYGKYFFLSENKVTGVVTVNAMTGETQHYDLANIPTWIDQVYSANLILHQLQLNGEYKNGFWNAQFAKEGVTMPTDGYNYLPMNDDLYLYTGITSVVSDESNIGFVLVNMRTKEATMYPVTAAEEFSAMASAEGSVQEKGYKATFPLLINIQGQPMYILSLKDSSGLIKAYALIDVQNYQRVYIDTSVDRLMKQYMSDHSVDMTDIDSQEALTTLKGQVEQIQATVVDGNTVYYFMLDGKVYRAAIQLNDELPFLQAGQEVELSANEKGIVREIKWGE